jgi:hypothetical protein
MQLRPAFSQDPNKKVHLHFFTQRWKHLVTETVRALSGTLDTTASVVLNSLRFYTWESWQRLQGRPHNWQDIYMGVVGDADMLYWRDQITCWLNCSWHGLVNVRLPLNSQATLYLSQSIYSTKHIFITSVTADSGQKMSGGVCAMCWPILPVYTQPVPTSNKLVITITLKPCSVHTRKLVVIFTWPITYLKKRLLCHWNIWGHNWYTVMCHIMMPDFIKFEWPCNAIGLNFK